MLDWSYEPLQDQHIRAAGLSYVALFLYQTMERLGGARRRWTRHASGFLDLLRTGYLPAVTVSTLPLPDLHILLMGEPTASIFVRNQAVACCRLFFFKTQGRGTLSMKRIRRRYLTRMQVIFLSKCIQHLHSLWLCIFSHLRVPLVREALSAMGKSFLSSPHAVRVMIR